MAGFGSRDQLVLQVVQGCKQGYRPMAFVVVCPRANVADAEGQTGLRSLQSLTLALLVATKHDGFVGRIKVQPNDVPKLLFELRVVGDLEGSDQVRA
jgi:hypothetical protein